MPSERPRLYRSGDARSGAGEHSSCVTSMSNHQERERIMSHIVRPIHRQALFGAGALALAASVIGYQRFHELTGSSGIHEPVAQATADAELPTVLVTARREPAVGGAEGERETPSARRLAARSAAQR